MQIENVKENAHQLINDLPDSATWEDLMYRIYVRGAIETGIKDSDQGRTVDADSEKAWIQAGHPVKRNTGHA